MSATPPTVELHPRPADELAVMTRAVFQAGLSWATITARWPAYVELFESFDPVRVAAMGEADLERIVADGRVVRSRRKIEATFRNARALVALGPGGIHEHVRGLGSYAAIEADLSRRFAQLGPLNVYYLLFLTNCAVPPFEVWERGVAADHPRMRETVAAARAAGRSPEVAEAG